MEPYLELNAGGENQIEVAERTLPGISETTNLTLNDRSPSLDGAVRK